MTFFFITASVSIGANTNISVASTRLVTVNLVSFQRNHEKNIPTSGLPYVVLWPLLLWRTCSIVFMDILTFSTVAACEAVLSVVMCIWRNCVTIAVSRWIWWTRSRLPDTLQQAWFVVASWSIEYSCIRWQFSVTAGDQQFSTHIGMITNCTTWTRFFFHNVTVDSWNDNKYPVRVQHNAKVICLLLCLPLRTPLNKASPVSKKTEQPYIMLTHTVFSLIPTISMPIWGLFMDFAMKI